APPEIAGAIRYANEFKVADLIITGRGGGSIEDLWAFNDERVARAIYASEIPVISAVGHKPDVTISDYVADMRASTPSNAAEIAVPDQNEMRETLDSLSIRSRQAMQKTLRELSQRLSAYAEKRVLTEPSVYIDNRRLELDHMRERLAAAGERKTAAGRQAFVRLAAALDAMSPLRVLTRGYSLAEDERGGLIKSASQLRPGDRVRLRFAEGGADCTVDSVNKGD
ncbi:MAG: exodeoxyribonuclease VII large subunit, partial [Oscillospiraceae bacterium]|nr:exodeoxyribonuclease VII large subunit [Oscillospiraceae bacterium]